jgi:hypothetical protein
MVKREQMLVTKEKLKIQTLKTKRRKLEFGESKTVN